MIRMMALSAVALALLPLAVLGDTIEGAIVTEDDYIGSRWTPPSYGIEATGGWSDWHPSEEPVSGGLRLDWVIAPGAVSGWDYSYTFTDLGDTPPDPEVSHWILQVSDFMTSEDYEQYFIWDEGGPGVFGVWEADPDSPGASSPGDNNGNPNLPGYPDPLHGLKFELTDTPYSFWSSQQPVWGSFYAKDGKQDGFVTTAWNPGLEGPGSGYDLTLPINWIPTPDTDGIIIPEPHVTVFALMALIAGAVARRRRRKEGEDG